MAEEKFKEFLTHEALIHKHGIRVRVIGDLDMLKESTRRAAYELMWATRNGTNAVLNICCPYTSRHEMSTVFETVKNGIRNGDLDESELVGGDCGAGVELLDALMFTESDTKLDILVRTSGEKRLSDFMLWQVFAIVDSYVRYLTIPAYL